MRQLVLNWMDMLAAFNRDVVVYFDTRKHALNNKIIHLITAKPLIVLVVAPRVSVNLNFSS